MPAMKFKMPQEHLELGVVIEQGFAFGVGDMNGEDAVKAAVMCEEVARTAAAARQLGPAHPIPQETIDRLYDRYQNVYGQHEEV